MDFFFNPVIPLLFKEGWKQEQIKAHTWRRDWSGQGTGWRGRVDLGDQVKSCGEMGFTINS